MANKTVIGLDMNCSKCKKLALHSVTKIEGIDSLTINMKESTLTVMGDADPTCMTELLKKKFRCARLIFFGSVPKKEEKEKPAKEEDKKKPAKEEDKKKPPKADPPKPKCMKCGQEFEPPQCCPACERKCIPQCWACLCLQAKCCPSCWDFSAYYIQPWPCTPNQIYPHRQPHDPACWARSPYRRPYADPDELWYVCSEDKQNFSCSLM